MSSRDSHYVDIDAGIEPPAPEKDGPPLFALARGEQVEEEADDSDASSVTLADQDSAVEQRLTAQLWRISDHQNELGSTLVFCIRGPNTGDPLLHTAAAGFAPLAAMRAVWTVFPGRGHGRAVVRKSQAAHLVALRNAAGKTALHVAARAGKISTVMGLFQFFCVDHITGLEVKAGEDTDVDATLPEAVDPTNPSYTDDEEFYSYIEYILMPLALVLERRNNGQGAAALGRAGGHEALAAWLEAALGRLDPLRRCDTETERILQRARHAYATDGVEGKLRSMQGLWSGATMYIVRPPFTGEP